MAEAATVCGGGCNRRWRRPQPYVIVALGSSHSFVTTSTQYLLIPEVGLVSEQLVLHLRKVRVWVRARVRVRVRVRVKVRVTFRLRVG